MPLFCDLHCHSTYSDGTCTPAQLVQKAEQLGLGALALTDHNTTAGLADFKAAAVGSSVTPVYGTEITCEWEGRSRHILALFLPEARWGDVDAYLQKTNELKEISNHECVQRLRDAGYRISYDRIKAAAGPHTTINRPHIARALVEAGYVASVPEAFEGLLKKGNGFYIPSRRYTVPEVIPHIKAWGALAVWAHPVQKTPAQEVEQLLPAAIAAGLDGIEVSHECYSPDDAARMEALAQKFHLLPSGGSDFHGSNKPAVKLGTGRGNVAVPLAFYHALRRRAGQ